MTPGPLEYILPIDPGKVFKGTINRPLTTQNTYHDMSAKSFKGMAGTQKRDTIFSGKYAAYNPGFDKDMSFSGSKIGPGPASRNTRLANTQQNTTVKSTMGIDSRRLERGCPSDFNGVPSPGHYRIQETKNTISNGKLFNEQ